MEAAQKKFTVDEGGNRRVDITADDIRQALNDIFEWFKTNATAYYSFALEGNKAPSDHEIDTLLK